MHKCLKCNRIISDVAEIQNGCACGSKVFVFIKDMNPGQLDIIDFKKEKCGEAKKEHPKPNGESHPPSGAKLPPPFVSEEGDGHEEVWLAKGGSVKPVGADVENIRQVATGVFELDVGSLSSGPLVVRDENGIYYVRLPFSQAGTNPDELSAP